MLLPAPFAPNRATTFPLGTCKETSCNGAVPEYYDPVCGCNNITYSNECYAAINGITSWKNGVCN